MFLPNIDAMLFVTFQYLQENIFFKDIIPSLNAD